MPCGRNIFGVTNDFSAFAGGSGRIEAVEQPAPDSILAQHRRMFVNRTVRFEQIRLVGFDMDYTLLPYKKESMEALAYRITVGKLVEKFGYPRACLDLPYDPEFVIRGLVVDKREGNLLKIDKHKHVGRAFHGRRELSKEERRGLYRDQKIRLGTPRYHWIDTLFALPEALLYADIVDFFELQQGRKRIDYRRLFDDIRAAIDEAHRDDSIKAEVIDNFDRYIEIDPDTPLMLHKLRSAGKKVFLLTNSYWKYTNAAMSYLLDGRLKEYPSWQNYFDFAIVGASKPAFFGEDRSFLEVDRETGEVSVEPAETFERQRVYQGGSLASFQRIIKARGEEIIYVGDHIYGDIIRSKKHTLWRTALVLEELEDELKLKPEIRDSQSKLHEAEERRSHLEHEITQCRLRISAFDQAIEAEDSADREELLETRRTQRLLLDRLRKTLRKVITERDRLHEEVDAAYNRYWGSVFKEGQENSCFGSQVEDYSCLYTARASNFLFYSPHQYFRSPRHWMPHEKL